MLSMNKSINFRLTDYVAPHRSWWSIGLRHRLWTDDTLWDWGEKCEDIKGEEIVII